MAVVNNVHAVDISSGIENNEDNEDLIEQTETTHMDNLTMPEQIEINSENVLTEQETQNKIVTNGPITTSGLKRKKKKEYQYQDAAAMILNNLVNQERTSVLQTLTHSIIPGFNISLTKTNFKKLSNYPLFQCSIPHSVYVSSEHANKVDLCHKRTKAHYDYMYNLNRQRAFYETAEKKKDYKKSMKTGVYPYTIVCYAELLENNPDPYFEGRYDWYYTGGNIQCDSDNNLIYHTTGKNLNELYVSRLKKKSKTHHLKTMQNVNFLSLAKHDSEIFEVQSLALKNRFSIRQKYCLTLLTYDDNEFRWDYVLSSPEIPIITSAGDNLDSEIIATGNLNKEVFLWDLKKSSRIPKQKLFQNNLNSTGKSKNWNCLCNFDKNIYAFATFNEFCLLDTRQSAIESKTNSCTFSKYKEICENISSLTKSNYDNIIYLGTTHKLFTIDTRFMGKEIKDKYIVQRWTHQMESAPLILKTYKWEENYELIAMSSLLSGDIRICENFSQLKNDKYKYTSPCLPYMPPSLLDGYKIAKINGECLNPATNLAERINSCTTGVDFLKKGEHLYFMISNSLGDIFSTNLNFDEDVKYSANYNKDIIKLYNEKVKLKLEKSPFLNLTDSAQLQGMSKVFRCSNLNNLNANSDIIYKEQVSTDNIEPKRPKRKAKWEKSVSQLHAYKDVLASNLLAVWDMELTQEEEILPVKDYKIKKHQDIEKVQEWLNESKFLDLPSPVEESFRNVNDVSFNTVIHSTLLPYTQPQINEIENTLINYSSLIDNTLNPPIPKKSKLVEEMKAEDSFDVINDNDSDIIPGQIPIIDKVIPKSKIPEKRKRKYVQGF